MKGIPVGEVDQCWKPPERVALITSVDPEEKPNIIAVGWLMRANVNPPVFAIGLGMKSQSCRNISASGELVVAIPGADLAEEVIYCGTQSGAEVDKFRETGLTATPGKAVKAPLIGECLANMECKVVATQDLQDTRIFLGEVLACWRAEEEEKSLLIVGEESGYELVHQEAGFRLGTVRG